MSLHEIPEPVVPPGQALDGVYLPQASRSPKRVRFSETNDHLQSDLCTRYRLHDMINRVSKRSYLCNSSFLKGMGITFSAGDNTAAARENTLKNKETRLPIWFWTPAWARLKTIKHLMTQLEWAHHPTPSIPFRYCDKKYPGQVYIEGLFAHELKGRRLAYMDISTTSAAAANYRISRKKRFTDQGHAALQGSRPAKTTAPWGEYPCVAPALIALAQLWEDEPVRERREYVTVYLLATAYASLDDLFVYTADIPVTLLDSLWDGPIAGNDGD